MIDSPDRLGSLIGSLLGRLKTRSLRLRPVPLLLVALPAAAVLYPYLSRQQADPAGHSGLTISGDLGSGAKPDQPLELKLSYTLSLGRTESEGNALPVMTQMNLSSLKMNSFLSQANAAEESPGQSAARAEKKLKAQQEAQRHKELLLNMESLGRQKLELPHGDPFVAKLPPPPPPPKYVAPSPPPPPPAPVAPALPYTYMGRFVENGVTTLFLVRQNQSYSVKQNDVLDNNYRVDRIDDGQVQFIYLPLNIPQTLNIPPAG